jgi:mono/diheme cytochrome c family protein
LALGLSILAWAVAVPFMARGQAQGNAAEGRAIDYNWDVRPILSENCFSCHGPDAKARRAGLRLDTAEGASAALTGRTERHAIVPGKPDESELVRRITAPTPALRMPPSATNKTLTDPQIDVLRAWIQQGAVYQPHWAFITPVKAAPPALAASHRLVNDIDRFIASRLEREGLRLSPEADRETLINRVTLILTGLPPTPAEVDAFVNDTSPSAFEALVDRLLASSAYGEQMASRWMDIARYAESDGFLDDYHDRLFWPYRDWLISAFNRNMRFDQFATWQIAGDLLPKASREQKLATAFLRVGRRTTENGAIDEEYRVEYVIDRTNTIGTAFLGLTTGCARCHDHKYDPISHKDFYSLSAFFNSTDEPGFYAPGSTGVTAGPTLPWTDAATDASIARLEQAVNAGEAAYTAARTRASRDAAATIDALLASPADLTRTIAGSIAKGQVAYYPFEETAPIPDDRLPRSRPQGRRPIPPPLAPESRTRNASGGARAVAGGGAVAPPPAPGSQGGGRPPATAPAAPAGDQAASPPRAAAGRLPSDLVRDDLVFTSSPLPGVEPAVLEAPILRDGAPGKGKAFFFNDTNRGFLGPDVGYFERTQPFSLDFWILAGQDYEHSTVLNHRENDNSGGAGYTIQLEKKRLRVDIMHSRAGNMLRVRTTSDFPLARWTHVTVTYDGSSRAAGMAVYLDGARSHVDIERDNLTRTIRVEGGGTLGDEFLGLQFGKRFRETTLKDGAIDEIRVFAKTLAPLEIRYLHDQSLSAVPRDVLRRELIEVIAAADPRVSAAAASLQQARDAHNDLVSVQPQVPVMGDTPRPRPAYVLLRGLYTEHGEEVAPRGLSAVFPWNEALPRNRIGLARWLFDPKHPLTSRVVVNRLWQDTFGRGLVETTEDFGSQGAIPTHPQLLDWLAVDFVQSGWDVKRLQKMLVMSATFRQSSNLTDEHVRKDARNVLLARFTRMRMPAEMVRDSALAAGGLLKRQIGGPSVYPYQPDGMWDGFSFYTYPAAPAVPEDQHHRRSLYSFIKRNAPHPAMASFDMPDRGVSAARRTSSNTPLQALVLLNDPQYVEAYRSLAAHVMRTVSDANSQITTMFRLAVRRRPLAAEVEPIRAYADAQVQRFSADRDAAVRLLKTGVTPADPALDPVRLAALTNLAAVIMNTPDAYTVR